MAVFICASAIIAKLYSNKIHGRTQKWWENLKRYYPLKSAEALKGQSVHLQILNMKEILVTGLGFMKPYCIRIAKQKVLTFIIDNLSVHRGCHQRDCVYNKGEAFIQLWH
jgi:hypothetical protein